jgi:hypothetical protein
MFSGAEQYESFNRLAEISPYPVIRASSSPFSFPRGESIELPHDFLFHGQPRATRAFCEETDTVAVFAVADGAIVFERYWLTGGLDTHWTSWCVGKSLVSALVGIAQEEGFIDSTSHRIADLACLT